MIAVPASPLRPHPDLLSFALALVEDGCSIIPVGRGKRPWLDWKAFQTAAATPELVTRWAADPRTLGFALVGGQVSGGVEVLDFDVEGFYPAWLDVAPSWARQLPTQRTGGGGYQVVYRRPTPPGNTKLAWAPRDRGAGVPPEPADREIAIETRGRGGYALVPYSLHPSGTYYAVLHGNWAALPRLTDDQAEELWTAARRLDQAPLGRQELARLQAQRELRRRGSTGSGASVVEAYNARTTIHEALLLAGYTRHTDTRYTRPGEDASPGGVHLLADQRGRLCSYHHSSNDPLNDGHLHDAFDLYVFSQHHGDFASAVKGAAQDLGISHPADTSVQALRADTEMNWGAVRPLPAPLPPVPTMPPEMVPPSLRRWVVDIAELNCLPLECVAAPAVVGLSGLVGRSVRIRPERHLPWEVVPNLWGAVVDRPGAMKSFAVGAGLEPLHALERRAAADHAAQQIDLEIERECVKAEGAALMKAAAKSGRLDRDTLRELKLREQAAGPTPKRYVVQNVTYEKLGELLRENPRGLTVTRDELGSWIADLSREERAEAQGFFLTAWNGEGTYSFERIGRGTVRADHPCVAVVGGIQPGPLNTFMAHSRAGGGRDTGMLQRFQLLVYPDGPGEWRRHDRTPDRQAKNRACTVFEALDTLGSADEAPILTFDDEAQAVWEVWRDSLERRLRGRELQQAPAFEAHLSKYRSLVPSLALVFHLAEVATASLNARALPPVSMDALNLALNWQAFLELHARKVYALELNQPNGPAHDLAARIRSGAVRDGDRLRDLRRKDWAGLRDERLGLAVAQLAALGWVQVQEVETGGRPAEVLRVHPELRGGEA